MSEKAKRAVQAILADLTDRRGLRQAWESIDKDIRKDIVAEWAKLIDKSMGEK